MIRSSSSCPRQFIAGCHPGTANLHLAHGKCRFRLVSNKDPLFNYREYGLENGQG